jgi:hypothetical protein
MGHFGKTITASDAYEDFTADLLGFFGFKYSENDDDYEADYERKSTYLTKEMIEARYTEMCDWFNKNYKNQDEVQFLGYHLLRLGVELENHTIDTLIYEFKNDAWAKQDVERSIYMKKAVEELEKYKTDKTPVDIDFYYGNFEHYFIYKSKDKKNELPTPFEIKSFIEENVGIKIKQILTDTYNLSFLVSDEDYKKVGSSLYGIKFLITVDE